jgi:hypothetical protein
VYEIVSIGAGHAVATHREPDILAYLRDGFAGRALLVELSLGWEHDGWRKVTPVLQNGRPLFSGNRPRLGRFLGTRLASVDYGLRATDLAVRRFKRGQGMPRRHRP